MDHCEFKDKSDCSRDNSPDMNASEHSYDDSDDVRLDRNRKIDEGFKELFAEADAVNESDDARTLIEKLRHLTKNSKKFMSETLMPETNEMLAEIEDRNAVIKEAFAYAGIDIGPETNREKAIIPEHDSEQI
jgi:hypothetical protein